MAELDLAPTDVLFSIGDPGDTVYVILSGDLDVIAPTTQGEELIVGRLTTDDVVGEITAVIGGNRTATVRAVTATRVLELAGSEFDRWLEANPERSARIATEARLRIDRTRVARVVAELVGPGQPALVEELTNTVEWVSLQAGHALFRQGDDSDAAYILVGGQMRVTATDDGGDVVLDTRIGRGDLIGEMGVIEQSPRNATVHAVRDCTLARIPKDAFERLTAEHPSLMLPLVRKVIARVGTRSQLSPHAGTLAIFQTSAVASTGLINTVVDEIGQHGDTLHLNTGKISAFLNRRDIAHATVGSAADARLVEFLHEVDVAHRWVVLECDRADSDWTKRAVRSADRVLVVVSPYPSASERAEIEQIRSIAEETGDVDLWAAQVNPNSHAHPRNTETNRALVGASRLLHLKRDDTRSMSRAGRLLSGNGLGVAFSGGGARSFGQIGALRAMNELGIAVDSVAGTSMGSIIGAFAALVDDVDRSLEAARREFLGVKLLDYTIPLTSIFAGHAMTDRITDVFGGLDVQDTMTPFVCLSTNLTQAAVHEHRSGDLVRALRASVSLPGVFPPVAMGDDLLVDGGVLENLPTRPLQRDPAVSRIIAIDVAPPGGPRAHDDFGLALSGTDVLRRKAKRDGFKHPPLAHTVIASMLVGSSQARTAAIDDDAIDLYLSLNLTGVKLLDFDQLLPAMERGYLDSLPVFAQWLDGSIGRDDSGSMH